MSRAPGRMERRRPWAMIVGLTLVALLTTTAVVTALLLGGPPAGVSSTPSPTVSETATASATSVSSPSASAAATPSTPELPEGLLPAGSVITIYVESVRIRSEPSLDGNVIGTMAAGEAAYIENAIDAGPVSADGYDWYRVAYAGGRDVWPLQDAFPGGYLAGWMAAGDGTQRFAVLADVTCPTEKIDLDTLANDLTAWERLVCIGQEPVTIEGRFGCGGCGGEIAGASPSWLADLTQSEIIAAQGRLYPSVGLALPPDASVPDVGDVVRATLHVDDAASATCEYAPPSDGATPPMAFDPVAVTLFCREHLVLQSFEVIGHEDFPD